MVRIETLVLTYVKFKPASITHPCIEKDLECVKRSGLIVIVAVAEAFGMV